MAGRPATGGHMFADNDYPVDIQDKGSAALHTLLEVALEVAEDEALSLEGVRALAREGLLEELAESGRIDPEEAPGVEGELGSLIDEYGEDALAQSFARPRASERLSAVLEAAIEEKGFERPATLGDVKAQVDAGLLADLEGRGEIDADERQGLESELDELIARYGEDALAEAHLRYF